MNSIETHGLTKRFGTLVAVNDLNLNVEEGKIYGFLGPNGAGKSTTISMLMGFVRPNSGSGKVMGYDILNQHYEIRKLTGYLPERPAFYDSMTGTDNMTYFGKLAGVADLSKCVPELLAQVGLEGRGKDKVKTYSHGMRQRLGIAITLLGNPKLLIMDEPTTGLDPQGSHDIREIIKKLKGEHVTIFLSSHILHEVQEIADNVGIIKDGRMITETPIDNFLRSTKGNIAVFEINAPMIDDKFVDTVRKVKGVETVSLRAGKLFLNLDEPAIAEDVNAALVGAGFRVREIKEIIPTLEDAFLKVIEGKKEG
ncbi:MAG TPA: ABC transporter ATP-binding protein [Methanocella sp.]|nr:ABC transporter ATP-binding protein [Methanocella sp.]